MYLLKYLLLVFLLSFSFSSKNVISTKSISNVDEDPVKIWEHEDNSTDNMELKKELDKLRDTFKHERTLIDDNYKASIKPMKMKRDDKISSLKESYNSKRKQLKKRYGVKNNKKPRNIKKDKIKPISVLEPKTSKLDYNTDEKKNKKLVPKKSVDTVNDKSPKSKK